MDYEYEESGMVEKVESFGSLTIRTLIRPEDAGPNDVCAPPTPANKSSIPKIWTPATPSSAASLRGTKRKRGRPRKYSAESPAHSGTVIPIPQPSPAQPATATATTPLKPPPQGSTQSQKRHGGPLLHLLTPEEQRQLQRRFRRGANWTPGWITVVKKLDELNRRPSAETLNEIYTEHFGSSATRFDPGSTDTGEQGVKNSAPEAQDTPVVASGASEEQAKARGQMECAGENGSNGSYGYLDQSPMEYTPSIAQGSTPALPSPDVTPVPSEQQTTPNLPPGGMLPSGHHNTPQPRSQQNVSPASLPPTPHPRTWIPPTSIPQASPSTKPPAIFPKPPLFTPPTPHALQTTLLSLLTPSLESFIPTLIACSFLLPTTYPLHPPPLPLGDAATNDIYKPFSTQLAALISGADGYSYVIRRSSNTVRQWRREWVCGDCINVSQRNKGEVGTGRSRVRYDCQGLVRITVDVGGWRVEYRHHPVHKSSGRVVMAGEGKVGVGAQVGGKDADGNPVELLEGW